MSKKVGILLAFTICITLILIFALFIGIILFIHQRRRYSFEAELKEIKNEAQNEVLRSQIEIQEQTLQNVSQEIHDNIGQYLTLIKLNLGRVALEYPNSSELNLNEPIEMLSNAISDLRNLSRTLSHTTIQDSGLVAAMEQQIDYLRKSLRYRVEYKLEGNYCYQAEHREILIFRIFQEAINNIVKHSLATCISIEMVFEKEQMKLEIKDNGKGFNNTPLEGQSKKINSSGLVNIQKRATVLGGKLDINSEINVGTNVSLSVPIILEK